LTDLKFDQVNGSVIKVDNQAAIAISNNPMFHGKTKHFKIKYYFLREVQCCKEIILVHCKTEDQLVDILTKAFPKVRFEDLREKIGVCIKVEDLREKIGVCIKRGKEEC